MFLIFYVKVLKTGLELTNSSLIKYSHKIILPSQHPYALTLSERDIR